MITRKLHQQTQINPSMSSKNTLYGSKIIDFSFMSKIIRTLSKDHVRSMKIVCKCPTVNIKKIF